MRIAIEINNIVRDCNSQAVKYFRKGYNTNYDEDVDLACTDLLANLPFASQLDRKTFKEIDYPYELFGCARTMHKHLHVQMSDWLDEHEDIEVLYFSLNESDLMIQSTYFFLSKGSRVRTVMFLKKPEEIWKYCDVAVTINKDVVVSKPENKYVVVIRKSDNLQLQSHADITYNSLKEMLCDKHFMVKILHSATKQSKSIFSDLNKLANKVKFLFYNGRKNKQ